MGWRNRISALLFTLLLLYIVHWTTDESQHTRELQHLNTSPVAEVEQNVNTLTNNKLADAKDCSTNPCQNRGRCEESEKSFTCHCDEEWMGKNCEEKLNERHKKREKIWANVLRNYDPENTSKRLPDVIGIGAEKCGTDAVITFLNQHPLIKIPGRYAESQFFNAKFNRGLKYYRLMMPNAANNEIVMEKTPAYFNFPPVEVPQRIKDSIPNVKLILVLCDPVNRTYSDFVHEKIIGGVHKSNTYDNLVKASLKEYESNITALLQKSDSEAFDFLTSLQQTQPYTHIFTTGLYYYHLLRWVELFDSNHLLILSGEDIVSQPGIEVEKLQDFLEIPKILLKEDFVRNQNTGFFCFKPKWSREAKIALEVHHFERCLGESKGRTRNKAKDASPETIKNLQNFYRPFNEKLFQFLNRKMNWQ